MLIDRMGGISIVQGDEVTAKGEEEGKLDLFGDGVAPGNQKVVVSVERIWVVQPGVATLEGSVVDDEGQEDKVAVDVKDGELMFNG